MVTGLAPLRSRCTSAVLVSTNDRSRRPRLQRYSRAATRCLRLAHRAAPVLGPSRIAVPAQMPETIDVWPNRTTSLQSPPRYLTTGI